MLITRWPIHPTNQNFRRSARVKLSGIPLESHFLDQLRHFFAAFALPNAGFMDNPEACGFGHDLLVRGESNSLTDLFRFNVGGSFVEKPSVENHYTSKKRRVNRDQR